MESPTGSDWWFFVYIFSWRNLSLTGFPFLEASIAIPVYTSSDLVVVFFWRTNVNSSDFKFMSMHVVMAIYRICYFTCNKGSRNHYPDHDATCPESQGKFVELALFESCMFPMISVVFFLIFGFCCLFACLLVLVSSRQGFTVYHWLSWNFLCLPGWPQICRNPPASLHFFPFLLFFFLSLSQVLRI